MNRRPRILLKLGVFLLLGAIVNVAVAWTLPHFTRVRWSDAGPPNAGDVAWWRATAPAGREVSDAPARVIRNKGFGWHTVYMIELTRTERSQPTGHTFERRMFGWPMLSVQSSIWNDLTPRQTLRGMVFFASKDWPIEPLWPGFAINTILYAAILWLLWVSPGRIKRFIRFRRHRCPACAYFISPNTCANGLCSECGARLP